MTRLDPLLAWARETAVAHAHGRGDATLAEHARTVLDTLGKPMPRGLVHPRVVPGAPGSPRLLVYWEPLNPNMTPDDAIGVGAALVEAGMRAKERSR